MVVSFQNKHQNPSRLACFWHKIIPKSSEFSQIQKRRNVTRCSQYLSALHTPFSLLKCQGKNCSGQTVVLLSQGLHSSVFVLQRNHHSSCYSKVNFSSATCQAPQGFEGGSFWELEDCTCCWVGRIQSMTGFSILSFPISWMALAVNNSKTVFTDMITASILIKARICPWWRKAGKLTSCFFSQHVCLGMQSWSSWKKINDWKKLGSYFILFFM